MGAYWICDRHPRRAWPWLSVMLVPWAAHAQTTQAWLDQGAVVPAQAAAQASGITPGSDLGRTLQRRELAERIRWARWGLAPPQSPPGPAGIAEAQEAVAAINQALRQSYWTADERTALLWDRAVAWSYAGQNQTIVTWWRSGEHPQTPPPPYAARVIADALSQAHDSQSAYALLHAANQADPGPYDRHESDPIAAEIWANYDRGQRDEAVAQMGEHIQSLPAQVRTPNAPNGEPNAQRLSAEEARISMWVDQGLLDQAQARTDTLKAAAPGSIDVMQTQAAITQRQGQLRAAQAQLAQAQTLDPTDPSTQEDLIGIDEARGNFADADARQAQLEAWYPGNGTVERGRADLDLNEGWQWAIDEGRTEKSNGDPNSGTRSIQIEANAWSPLWDDHWRIGTIVRWSWADVPEGIARWTQTGLGVSYQTTDFITYVHVLPTFQGNIRNPGWETGFKWNMADAWTWSMDGSTASPETPIRAIGNAIISKTLAARLDYTPSAETRVSWQAGRGWFSDGNQRHSWAFTGEQQIWTRPDSHWSATWEISGSTNSSNAGPYYSPLQDRAYLGGLSWDSLLYAHDVHTATQGLTMQLGRYQERNYASTWIGNVRYGQTYQWAKGRTWSWHVVYSNPVHDGRRENDWWLEWTIQGGAP